MIGKQVGRYRIVAEVGRGGMGVVYRAIQVTLDRTVAVKMLSQQLATSGEYLGRFRREAETLARLAHPNIVHIYDIEEAEGSHFIIMEFVEGPSLSRVLSSERRLSPARARDITHALTGALAAAHQKGIVHRDIKPDNILFSLDGRPKITDFGIAHMRDSDVKTRTGIMLGTPNYMSPEQAGGRPVSAASDVYSLGVVLYEMLTGRVPFTADTPVAVALKHLNEAPMPLRRHVPSLPADLCRVVERALEKDPSRRYRTAGAFRRALTELELGRPVGAGLAPEADEDAAGAVACSSCGFALRGDFLSCPRCARPVPREMRAASGGGGRPEPSPKPGRERVPALAAGGLRGAAVGAGEAVQVGAAAAADVAVRVVRAASDVAARAAERAGAGELGLYRLPEVAAGIRGRFARADLRGVPLTVWLGLALLGLGLFLALLTGLLAGETGRGALAGESGASGEGRIASASPPPGMPSGAGVPIAGDWFVRDRSESRDDERGAWGEEEGAAEPDDRRAAADGTEGREPDDEAADRPEEPERRPEPEREERAERGAADGSGPEPETEEERREGVDREEAFDEAAARGAIAQVVENQRRATESGDPELFLQDIAPGLRAEAAEQFASLHREFRDIRSQVSGLEIEFHGRDGALVQFQVVLTGRLPREGRRVMLFQGPVIWQVARVGGRWLITAV